MNALVDFLRVRLDEDEQAARRAIEWWDSDREAGYLEWPSQEASAHVARNDPARTLRKVEALRRIIGLHGHGPHECVTWDEALGETCACYEVECPTLLLLALPYADHPDYREAWRP